MIIFLGGVIVTHWLNAYKTKASVPIDVIRSNYQPFTR
ncbi:Uncharacterised protein [Wolbachia endosymbiont wPip_Mol of Culex molestus]|nr:Uncharacterised protein [Wolbachia endosymbiont wPip_Mol of Culex molestus]